MDSPAPKDALPPGYRRFLGGLKDAVRAARFQAALRTNRVLILLYWDLGRQIVETQKRARWGTTILAQIALDLRAEFPEMRSFSQRNIGYMRAFYRAWTDDDSNCPRSVGDFEVSLNSKEEPGILQRGVAKLTPPPDPLADLPWRHNIALIEKLSDREERLWYAVQAFQNAWPRDVLVRQIQSGLHRRQGKAQSNFALTLPAPQAKRAQEALKDEYALDFLAPGTTQEKNIEQGIIENTQRFLMEFGTGFAFIGRQKRLKTGRREHVMDLLLYHTLLHCYVVVELKAGAFQPQHTGALSAYLGAADRQLRRPGDNPSIGVILCRTKDRIAVEYALRDQRKPMGVASYRLTKQLPRDLRATLPTAQELEKGLGG